MSTYYDDAVALLDDEVHRDCEYYVYSQLRDAVDCLEDDRNTLAKLLKEALENKFSREDELKAENARLRELVRDYYEAPCVECHPWDEGWHGCKHCDGGDCTLAMRAIELGIEVEQ